LGDFENKRVADVGNQQRAILSEGQPFGASHLRAGCRPAYSVAAGDSVSHDSRCGLRNGIDTAHPRMKRIEEEHVSRSIENKVGRLIKKVGRVQLYFFLDPSDDLRIG
jgi:hypothetical protein